MFSFLSRLEQAPAPGAPFRSLRHRRAALTLVLGTAASFGSSCGQEGEGGLVAVGAPVEGHEVSLALTLPDSVDEGETILLSYSVTQAARQGGKVLQGGEQVLTLHAIVTRQAQRDSIPITGSPTASEGEHSFTYDSRVGDQLEVVGQVVATILGHGNASSTVTASTSASTGVVVPRIRDHRAILEIALPDSIPAGPSFNFAYATSQEARQAGEPINNGTADLAFYAIITGAASRDSVLVPGAFSQEIRDSVSVPHALRPGDRVEVFGSGTATMAGVGGRVSTVTLGAQAASRAVSMDVIGIVGPNAYANLAGTVIPVRVQVAGHDERGRDGVLVRAAVVGSAGVVDPDSSLSDASGAATFDWALGEGESELHVWLDARPDQMVVLTGTGAPRLGSLRVVLSRKGTGTDADGVSVQVLDTTYPLLLGDTLLVSGVPEGRHTVRVSGLAPHCSPLPDSMTVDVPLRAEALLLSGTECVGEIVFTERRWDLTHRLFFLDGEGVRHELAADVYGAKSDVSWSPDGSFLVFVLSSDTRMWIYRADLDGSTRTLSAHELDHAYWARVSPDGEWVVYGLMDRSSGYANRSAIRLVRSDGTDDHALLPPGGYHIAPTWSPDGGRIAFGCWQHRNDGLCIMRADGSGLMRAPVAVRWPQLLRWSPDGSRIAFVSFHDTPQETHILRLDNWEMVKAVPGQDQGFVPIWSPDGSHLLMLAAAPGGLTRSVQVVDRDGKNPVVLGEDILDVGGWAPDGQRVIFSGRANGLVSLVDPDGSDMVTVRLGGGPIRFMLWRPTGGLR